MKKKLDPPYVDYIRNAVEQEGFDYTFRFYSDFPEIQDKKFRRLFSAYNKAANELSEYCRIKEEEE